MDLADVLKADAARKAKRRKRTPLKTNEEVRQVLRKYIPELNDGSLEIVSMARIVGQRCLIVVRPARPADNVERMVNLRRGPEMNALIDELAGEFLSISRWNESTEEFIRWSFSGAEVRATVHSSKAATVVVNRTMFDAMHQTTPKISRDSQWRMHSEMVQLVSEVTGWSISLEIAH